MFDLSIYRVHVQQEVPNNSFRHSLLHLTDEAVRYGDFIVYSGHEVSELACELGTLPHGLADSDLKPGSSLL